MMKRLTCFLILLLILLSACSQSPTYDPADDPIYMETASLGITSYHMRDLREFLAWAAVTETKETDYVGFSGLLERIRSEAAVITPLYNSEDVITAFDNITEPGKAGAMAISALAQEPGYQYTVLIEGKRMLVRVCFMKPAYADKTYECYLDYCADTIGKEKHDEPNLAEVQKYRPTATAYYETKLTCSGTEQQCLVTKTDIDTTVVYLMNPYYIWISGEPTDMEEFMGQMDKLTFEKQPLPDPEEATSYLAELAKQDEEYAAEEAAAAAAAAAEAKLGPPKAEKFVWSQSELLEFIATVDDKTYPAVGDRGQGLLSPLVGAVRTEGYLLLPYADGTPAEPTKGYCTACSRQVFNMPACSVEGFYAGKDNKLYAYFTQYPSKEEAELLMQGIETFKQSWQGHTVNLKTWKDSEFIKDYREVTFTLNGEEQTGFATVWESSTKLEFFYDGKLITLTCAEEGADSFDLSLFEHLTLEKVPLPE